MYRLTLYYLIGLIAIAIVFGFFGLVPYRGWDIIISTTIAVAVCYIANLIFAKLFHAVTNIESVFITALILVLIVPAKMPVNLMFVIAVSVLAMAAKYLPTIEKRHIFNPAAAGVAALALLSPEHVATWWVGSLWMLPFVVIGGILVMRKIKRESLIVAFLLAYFLILAVFALIRNGTFGGVFESWQISILHTGLLFFVFVMLTEPLTSPAVSKIRNAYGILVAVLFATPQMRLAGIAFTPEIALCIGNIFTYVINPNYRLNLKLIEKLKLSSDTMGFVFAKPEGFKFTAGQYMEWTLPHRNVDSRGNRRYFSIASSPGEKYILLVVKFYSPSSSFKATLASLAPESHIIATQVAGDFVLPKDLRKPLVLVAGGVGIAPFRSMIEYIIDNNLKVDIVLIYANRHESDILYLDIFKKAQSNGLRTIYTLTDTQSIGLAWEGMRGYLTSELISQNIPDFKNRLFYLSGPQLMVSNFEKILARTGVARKNIKTDFFPGYSET